jgi:hypothetical protein
MKTTLKMNNFKIPNGKMTNYYCKNFKLSELGLTGEQHAVRFSPVVDNKNVVHHMILFTCPFSVNSSSPEFQCWDMPNCEYL